MTSPPPGKGGGRRPLRIGKYEVVSHIATGGMGAVYKATDVDLKRDVALKVLSPELAVKPNVVERFHREARSAAKLRHENIVAIYECGESNGTYFLALEFVDGIDLHEYVNRNGKLPPEEARQFMVQAARALDHAHKQNIIHRDIKPSNFLLTTRHGKPVVKLTDMGLAREINTDEFRVTKAGTTVGTVDYMAPEQARDSSLADIRSDIYSLGCTLFHLLAGHCPFPEGSLTERLYKHIETEAPDIREFNSAVSPALAAVLRRMLAKKPEDRFQTPAELLQALLAKEPVARPDDSPGEDPLAGLAALADAETVAPKATPRPRSKPASSQEAARAAKAAASEKREPTRRRRRDTAGGEESDTDEAAWPEWWPWAVGGIGLAVVVGVVLLVLAGRGGKPTEDGPQIAEPPPPRTPRVVPAVIPEPGTAKSPDKIVKVVEPVLPVLYTPRTPLDPQAVRQEFEGKPPPFPEAASSVVFRVSRVPSPGPNNFRSLAEAVAKAPADQQTVIEVHDNGPLFEPAFPVVRGRSLLVRAGKGYRPLIAWDIGVPGEDEEKTKKLSSHWLAVEKGNLALDNLDVVVKWTETRVSQPAALFRVAEGDFLARNCTFSVAGKHPQGVIVARLEGGSAPSHCRLSHCHARGAALTVLALHHTAAEALLDDCLLVGVDQPLVHVDGGGKAATVQVRLVRSTLVAGATLLRVQSGAASEFSLACFCCDSLLAQSNPRADSNMVLLRAGARTGQVSWRAVNCVYAGWKDLLDTGERSITVNALDAWRLLWKYGEGDLALFETWPRTHRAEPADTPPAVYDTAETSVYFAAVTGPGPLGCNLTALPAGRPSWEGLTYDRVDVPLLSLPVGDQPPSIPVEPAGLYHGERLQLKKGFDLGQYLQARLARQKPGPQVVLHLSGSGEHETSPLRLTGAHLTIFLDRADARAEPPTLSPSLKTAGDKEALIEVDGGDLELLNLRIVFAGGRFGATPRHMLKVRGGGLRLAGCYLQGPVGVTTDTYRALIDLQGPTCAIDRCALLSTKTVLQVRGAGAQLRLRQSLGLATGDLLRLDAGAAARAGFLCTLENNTLAVRGTLLQVVAAPDLSAAAEPSVIRADHNFFLDPFNDSPGQSCLLRCDGGLLTHGQLLWQGKGNAFDHKRLCSYFTPGSGPVVEQPFKVWERLWGTPGTQDPILVDLARSPFKLDPLQLQRLAFPRSGPPRVGEDVPGADLTRLGIPAAKK